MTLASNFTISVMAFCDGQKKLHILYVVWLEPRLSENGEVDDSGLGTGAGVSAVALKFETIIRSKYTLDNLIIIIIKGPNYADQPT
jgi:hypothetical protein